MTVRVVGPRDSHYDKTKVRLINTTSRASGSEAWSKGLSPFFLGPVELYGGYRAKNVENAWQYSKVYEEHVGVDGGPDESYFEWAREGWATKRAVRYPMGNGAVPEFSWWDGAKLDYVQARKKIYVPLYAKAVFHTQAFKRLSEIYQREKEVWLWDFDGYDHVKLGKSLKEVLNNPRKKMGHAFVLAMLLEALDER